MILLLDNPIEGKNFYKSKNKAIPEQEWLNELKIILYLCFDISWIFLLNPNDE